MNYLSVIPLLHNCIIFITFHRHQDNIEIEVHFNSIADLNSKLLQLMLTMDDALNTKLAALS